MTDKLLQRLDDIRERSQGRDWIGGLTERKRKELEFHNHHRDGSAENMPTDIYEVMYGNKRFYATTRRSQSYVDNWIATRVPGKVFLDYACGDGGRAIQAAKAGAALSIGLDISDVSVRNAERLAAAAGVAERCRFVQGDCEATGLPDECADVIICSGMLHHLDLSYSFPELRRILAQRGVILAVEALDHNPAIKLYRRLTPAMRTEWEKNHILSMRDIKFAERFFRIGEVRFWHLLSIAGAFFHRNERVLAAYLKAADALDNVVLKLPLIRLLAWQFTFELHKKK
jgi:ubiquinone/menaquinone biosynthesis C-methylase UbiE